MCEFANSEIEIVTSTMPSNHLTTASSSSIETDALWWAANSFSQIDAPYRDFGRIVRGYDPEQRGFVETEITYSLDGGAGRGGVLIAACLSFDGELLDILTV